MSCNVKNTIKIMKSFLANIYLRIAGRRVMIAPFLKDIRKYVSHDQPVEIVLDIGSRDLKQSIQFVEAFPHAEVVAFEANPDSVKVCAANLQGYENNIRLVPKAVNSFDGETTFYRMTVNVGGSSLFRMSNERLKALGWELLETEIPCCRIDTELDRLGVTKVDIVWMDLEGAELIALRSMGTLLKTVKAIYTEACIKPYRHDQCTHAEIDEFLKNRGFKEVRRSRGRININVTYVRPCR